MGGGGGNGGGGGIFFLGCSLGLSSMKAYSGNSISAGLWAVLELSLSLAFISSYNNYDSSSKSYLQYRKLYDATDDEKEVSAYRASAEKDWNNHVELGLWADLMLIAPVTAKTMAKMVAGECNNLLLAVYLSVKCPVYFAPAMDLDMYKHFSTKKNIEKLESFGNKLIL